MTIDDATTDDAQSSAADAPSTLATAPTTLAAPPSAAHSADGAAGPDAKAVTPILRVRDLKRHFAIYGGIMRRQVGTVYAVDGVDFDIAPGEIFSLVGESGCGKTTLGRTVLRLIEPTSGVLEFEGQDLLAVSQNDMRPMRRKMQIIFQDPFGALNPRMPVSDIIGEGLLAQGMTDGKARNKKAEDALERVGLRRDYTRRYPHEFSGGQRQRIGIARALAVEPDFVVCDEPVSALDVSIQSQVLNLLLDLRRDFNLTYLFISHNLSVVQYFSDRVGVMYLGRIVEIGSVEQLYRAPRHPYTVALLSAIPDPNPRKRKKRLVLKGDVPSPAAPPSGCRFHTRCWLRERLGNPERCVTEDPGAARPRARPLDRLPLPRGDRPQRRRAGRRRTVGHRYRGGRAGVTVMTPRSRPALAGGQHLAIRAIRAFALTLVVATVAACGQAGSATTPTPAGSGVAVATPGPKATPWPMDVVEAVLALAAADAELWKAGRTSPAPPTPRTPRPCGARPTGRSS